MANIYDFENTTNFLKKVDMSSVGNAMDCGECHVGGGAMNYIPTNGDQSTRPDLRDVEFGAEVTSFNYFIDTYDLDGDGVLGDAVKIDYDATGVVEMDCFACHLEGYEYAARKATLRLGQFDLSRAIGAGIATPEDNGLTVKDHDTHKPATTRLWTDSDYGTKVVYDADMLVEDGGEYKLAPAVVDLISAAPPSDNCVNCHFAVHAVDWKKRGEAWRSDQEVHFSLGCMGCHERKGKDGVKYGDVGTSGQFMGGSDAKKLGMCDPAKGGASKFDALANQLDKVEFKSCENCHMDGGDGSQNFSAPNPDIAHAAAGLNTIMAQSPGNVSGNADASHLELISCEACHVKKDASITGGAFVDGTGPDSEGRLATHDNEFVTHSMDKSVALYWGPDSKLYPANYLVSFIYRDKNDQGDDINNDGKPLGMDAVLQTHIAKSVDYDHSKALFADGVVTAAEVSARMADLAATQQAAIDNDSNDSGYGMTYTNVKMKLSALGVPFKITHNVSPAADAWGADPDESGDGCDDCHSPNAGFYNGAYDMQGSPFADDPSWMQKQRTPFTKVNGFSKPTDIHPNVKDKAFKRSIALELTGNASLKTSSDLTGLYDADRSELIYEKTFKVPTTGTFHSEIEGVAYKPSSDFDGGAGTANNKGKLIKIRAKCVETDDTGAIIGCDDRLGSCAETDDTLVVNGVCEDNLLSFNSRTLAGNYADAAAVLTGLGAAYTDTQDEYSMALNTAGNGFKITAKSGYKVQIWPQTDSTVFGFDSIMYTANPIVPVVSGIDADESIDGQAEMLAYLDAITLENSGLSQNADDEINAIVPTATISSIGAATFDENTTFGLNNAQLSYYFDHYTAIIGTELTFNALDQGAGYSYYWQTSDLALGNYGQNDFRDGATQLEGNTATYTFDKLGTFTITLTAVSPDGTRARSYAKVTVVNPASTIAITPADLTAFVSRSVTITFDTSGLSVADQAAADQLVIYWGDGKKDTVAITGTSTAVDHDYMLFSGFDNDEDGTYTYKLSVYTWDSANNVKVDMKQTATVEVTLP